jgi:hypothetical protein
LLASEPAEARVCFQKAVAGPAGLLAAQEARRELSVLESVEPKAK